MQRVLVILSVIVLVTASLGVGALAANWPFWSRAWAWHAADGGWPRALPGLHMVARGGGGMPLRFAPARADLAQRATAANTHLLLRFRAGEADAWLAPGADAAAPIDGRGLTAAVLEPLWVQLETGEPGLLERPVGAWLEQWRQEPRGGLTPRALLDAIAAGIDEPPTNSPLNPFSARARLAAGPGFDRAALLAFGREPGRDAATAQVLAILASQVGGQPFASLLQDLLWSRIAAHDARLPVDRRHGDAAAHCCMLAAAEDWLRLGLHIGDSVPGNPARVIRTAGRTLVAGASGAVLWVGEGSEPSGLEMLLEPIQSEAADP